MFTAVFAGLKIRHKPDNGFDLSPPGMGNNEATEKDIVDHFELSKKYGVVFDSIHLSSLGRLRYKPAVIEWFRENDIDPADLKTVKRADKKSNIRFGWKGYNPDGEVGGGVSKRVSKHSLRAGANWRQNNQYKEGNKYASRVAIDRERGLGTAYERARYDEYKKKKEEIDRRQEKNLSSSRNTEIE